MLRPMKPPPKLSWLNYRAVLLAALAFALALLAVAFSFLSKAEPTQPGVIEKVIDGDTIKALSLTIRLIGYDAPEAASHARSETERNLAHRATTRLRQIIAAGGLDLALVPCNCRP